MSNIPPPPPPPPPPGWGQPQSLEPIGAWMRFLARFIDGLVLLIPAFIIGAAVGGGAFAAGMGGGTGGDAAAFFAGLLGTLLSFGYQVYFESTRGQTVGKMATSIKVIGPDGAVPSQAVAMKRNAWMLLSVIPIVGGLIGLVANVVIGISIANDSFKRGTHDNFAGGTAVVRAK